MSRDDAYVLDMLRFTREVIELSNGVTRDEYLSDLGTRRGIERSLEPRQTDDGEGIVIAAERWNLRSPTRQRWGSWRQQCEPRSGDIYALELSDEMPPLRGSSSSDRFPNADALGYVDCTAPRFLTTPKALCLEFGRSETTPKSS